MGILYPWRSSEHSLKPLGQQPLGVRFWSALQGFLWWLEVVVMPIISARYPKMWLKMFNFSPECRCRVSLRYLAENLPTHPTCLKLSRSRMVWGRRTLTLCSTCGVTPTNRLLRNSSSKVPVPPLDGNDCCWESGFPGLAFALVSCPTKTRGSLDLLKNWLLGQRWELSKYVSLDAYAFTEVAC